MITTVLTATEKVLTLEETRAKLLVEETTINRSLSTSGSKALTARPEPARAQGRSAAKQKPKETRKCHPCGKPGHMKADCWKRQREEGSSGSKQQGQGFKGAQHGNLAAAAHQYSGGQAWMLDSGASNHLSSSKAGMNNLKEAPADLFMTFGNGAGSKVEAVGDLVLRIPASDFETVTLSDVFYVQEAIMNLLSIRASVARGIDVHFSRDENGYAYCLLEKGGKVMVEAIAASGVFAMVADTGEKALAAVESPELWHRRYGHLGFDSLVKLAAGDLVTGMKVDQCSCSVISAADVKAAGF